LGLCHLNKIVADIAQYISKVPNVKESVLIITNWLNQAGIDLRHTGTE